MPQPYQYMTGLPSPAQTIQQGLKFAQSIEAARQQRAKIAIEQQKRIEAQQRQQQLQSRVAEITANPSHQDIVNLQLEFPELAKQIDYARKGQSEIDQKSDLNQALSIYAPLQAGNDEQAIINANNLAEAYRNSGDEREAQQMENMADLIKTNRNSAYVTSGTYLAAADPDLFEKLGKERRAEELLPYKKAKLIREPAPLVQVGLSQEKAYAQEFGKIQARRVGEILDRGRDSQGALDTANQLLAFRGITTGTLEPLKANIAGVMKGLGAPKSLVKRISDVGTAQALDAVTNRGVNAVLNLAKGPQTEGDAIRARSTIANLGDDPRAFTFKANTMKAAALRNIERAEFYGARADQGMKPDEINKQWRDYIDSTPNLSATVTGPDGLPMYFFQFKEHARTRRPGITDQEIIEAWRQINGQ